MPLLSFYHHHLSPWLSHGLLTGFHVSTLASSAVFSPLWQEWSFKILNPVMILLLKPSVHSCQAWNKIQTPSPCRIWLLLSWLTSVHTTLPFTLHFAASLIFFQVFKYAKLIPASGPLHLTEPPAWTSLPHDLHMAGSISSCKCLPRYQVHREVFLDHVV